MFRGVLRNSGLGLGEPELWGLGFWTFGGFVQDRFLAYGHVRPSHELRTEFRLGTWGYIGGHRGTYLRDILQLYFRAHFLIPRRRQATDLFEVWSDRPLNPKTQTLNYQP